MSNYCKYCEFNITSNILFLLCKNTKIDVIIFKLTVVFLLYTRNKVLL